MRNYLDEWIGQKIGAQPLTREVIEEWQLAKLNETLKWAVDNSPFYKARYGGMSINPGTTAVNSFEDFAKLPFTYPDDVREHGMDMVCVPQSQISRIVTLDTSGTTGCPKRIFFTEEDQELTIDFFHNGMQLMVDRSDTVMILMPCRMPGSIGVLLQEGLERFGAKAIPYGLPKGDLSDGRELLDLMEREKVTCAVALATHMAALAKMHVGETQDGGATLTTMQKNRNINLKCVLLSAEYVSEESRRAIKQGFNCDIFEHFGMTETGLGGSVSCEVLEGSHPREADLYFEIIDPNTGKVVPDGQWGEIVFTTLTRKGMPFIRYRTGDSCRWLSSPCKCGSVLKRLDRVGDRGLAKGGGLAIQGLSKGGLNE